ncbi:fimbrial biogenesis chaperone [Proteus mirabilis]|uniref:fimbrial biogenesis chaperone n=1 Tax=Proteus mirabilis TaxID=584 RepID=UPI00367EBDE3
MVNKIRFFQYISLCVLGVLFLSFQAKAGVGLSQTRIIINGDNNISSIIARNSSQEPYLVTNYITEKIGDQTPIKNVFTLTPSIFRLAPESQNTIKIQMVSTSQAKDRETLFYFHSRNIPSTDKGDDGMKIAMENIIKVFYRPTHLSIKPEEIEKKLTVKSNRNGITIENPTPYHINLIGITVNKESLKVNKTNNIIKPFSSENFISNNKTGAVNIHIINDLGGESVYNKKL